MVSNLFSDVVKDYNNRLKTPVLGTFILVWVVRNWEVLYSVYLIPTGKNVSEKIQILKSSWSHDHNIFEETLWSMVISLGMVFIGYFLINISRVLTYLSEEKVGPWIKGFVKSKHHANRLDLNREIQENETLREINDKLRLQRTEDEARFDNQRVKYLEEIQELKKRLIEQTKVANDYQDEQRALNDKVNHLNKFIRDNEVFQKDLKESISARYFIDIHEMAKGNMEFFYDKDVQTLKRLKDKGLIENLVQLNSLDRYYNEDENRYSADFSKRGEQLISYWRGINLDHNWVNGVFYDKHKTNDFMTLPRISNIGYNPIERPELLN